jgi:hypothetical protein
MEDRENFRALAAMFALSRLAYYSPIEDEEFERKEMIRVAKRCVKLADALIDELNPPEEGIVALKKRKKNVQE